MTFGFGFLGRRRSGGETGPPPSPPWVVGSGNWGDTLLWIDTETWKDAPTITSSAGATITSSDGETASLTDNGDGTFAVIVNSVNVGTITQAQITAGGWITVVAPTAGMSGSNVVLVNAGHVIYVGSVSIETDVEVLAEVAVVGTALPYDATAHPEATLTVRWSFTTGSDTLVVSSQARAAPLKLAQFRDSHMQFAAGTNPAWPVAQRTRRMTLAVRITGSFNNSATPANRVGSISIMAFQIGTDGALGRVALRRTNFTPITPQYNFPTGDNQNVSYMLACDLDGGLPNGETFVAWINRTGTWERIGGHSNTAADASIHPNDFGSQNSSEVGGTFDVHNHIWWANQALDPATNWTNFFNADGTVKALGASGVIAGVTPVIYMVGQDFVTGNNRGSGGLVARARTVVNVVNQ